MTTIAFKGARSSERACSAFARLVRIAPTITPLALEVRILVGPRMRYAIECDDSLH